MVGSAKLSVLVVLVAASAVALVTAHFAGAEEHGSPVMTGDALGATNRSHLVVCVDTGRGEAPAAADVTQVRQELLSLRSESREFVIFFGEPEAIPGCPESRILAAAPPQSGRELHRLLHSDAPGIRSPQVPSPYRLFVYVLPVDTYRAYFGDAAFVEATAEMFCEGHVCAEVTTSLYLPEGFGQDALREGLKRALGIYHGPQPTMPDLSPCIGEDPPPWCRGVPPTLLPQQ